MHWPSLRKLLNINILHVENGLKSGPSMGPLPGARPTNFTPALFIVSRGPPPGPCGPVTSRESYKHLGECAAPLAIIALDYKSAKFIASFRRANVQREGKNPKPL